MQFVKIDYGFYYVVICCFIVNVVIYDYICIIQYVVFYYVLILFNILYNVVVVIVLIDNENCNFYFIVWGNFEIMLDMIVWCEFVCVVLGVDVDLIMWVIVGMMENCFC